MLISYPLAVVSSLYIGGLKQCICLIFLGYWYNDLGGADTSWVTRNMINAAGFISFSTGAMEDALGMPLQWTPKVGLLAWYYRRGCLLYGTDTGYV
jgi:hypothetical protein